MKLLINKLLINKTQYFLKSKVSQLNTPGSLILLLVYTFPPFYLKQMLSCQLNAVFLIEFQFETEFGSPIDLEACILNATGCNCFLK